MKKIFFALSMAAGLSGMFSSCSKNGEVDVDDGSAIIVELKEWLLIQEDGSCGFPLDENSGNYIIGVDNAGTAGRVAQNLSMGASSSKTLKVILPAQKGDISVSANSSEGHYYNIKYNVKGVMEAELDIVNEGWLNGENSIIWYQKNQNLATYLCNVDTCHQNFKAVITAKTIKCPACGSTDVTKKY